MSKLSLVATPIGNLEDITIRAVKTLFSSDAILCEDTRRAGFLLHELIDRYGEAFDMTQEAAPRLISYYDEIEEKSLPGVIALLEEGKDLALISDAGTPLVSDPGFRLVRECAKRAITVQSIPGASAVLAALTSSGLPSDKFMFLGYPPEKEAARRALLAQLKEINTHVISTYIFYCAPHKLIRILESVEEAYGDIPIVLARELTKIHEEVWRGVSSQARAHFSAPQGEFVLLFRLP